MKLVPLALALVASLALAGCASNNVPPASTTPSTATPAVTGSGSGLHAQLVGDGSTFVAPLMDKWRTDFAKANAGVTISYTGGGSGKGRGDITKGLVDFAGSDAPMSAAEQANATDVLHVPVAAGGVVVAYNVPDVAQPLRFDADAIAGIFLGQITKWNDPKLAALNPGVQLPNEDIAVVHRSDGSGTTATFTDYLKKVSPAWASQVGAGSSVNWPVGTGANGNNGVGAQIQQIPYSVGYLGSEWSNVSKVQTGLVQNKAGQFVAGTPASVSAAVDAALAAGAFDQDLKGSATNQEGADAYPIAAVTWVLVHQHQQDLAKGQALAAFLWFALHEGQAQNEALNYAKIPPSMIAKAEALVNGMDANGQKLR